MLQPQLYQQNFFYFRNVGTVVGQAAFSVGVVLYVGA